MDGDSELAVGMTSACASVATGSASVGTPHWFCSERTREIRLGIAVPLRKNSTRVLSINVSPMLLDEIDAGVCFIEDDNGGGDGNGYGTPISGAELLVTPLRAINMSKIRRHSSAVDAFVKSRRMSFASVSVKTGIEGELMRGTALRDTVRAGETGCCTSEPTSFGGCPFVALPFI